jgi:hypothetical protein
MKKKSNRIAQVEKKNNYCENERELLVGAGFGGTKKDKAIEI